MLNLKVPVRVAERYINLDLNQKIWAGVAIRMDGEEWRRLCGAVLSNRNTM